MRTLGELLELKGHSVHTVTPGTLVYDAITIMADQSVGAVLVVENGDVAGIVSERDYARKCILKNRSSRDTPVSEIMTSEVICVNEDMTVEEGMGLMSEKRIRHLPVFKGRELTGIVSIGDLVKAIIAEQKFLIDQLEHYIAG